MATSGMCDWSYDHFINPKCNSCGVRVWSHKSPEYNDHYFNEIVLEGLS